jgi:hypothetical protein
LIVYPIIDGLPYDGSGGRANLSVITSDQSENFGEFSINYTVPLTYDYISNLIFSANITEYGTGVYVRSDCVQAPVYQSIQIVPALNQTSAHLYVFDAPEPFVERGDTFTISGYVQTATGYVYDSGLGKYVLQYTNKGGLIVHPIVDGLPYDGTGGRANLSVLSSNVGGHTGEYTINFPVPLTYDFTNNLIFSANITEYGPGINVRGDTVQAPIYHSIQVVPGITQTTAHLYLLPATEQYVQRGDSFTIRGYTQTVSGYYYDPGQLKYIPQYANAGGLIVYPIVDGVNYNGVGGNANYSVISSDQAGSIGEFSISFPVPVTYDVREDLVYSANISQIGPGINVREDTVQAPSSYSIDVIAVSSQISFVVVPTTPIFVNDRVTIEFNCTDELGAGDFNDLLTNGAFFFYFNGNINNILNGVAIDSIDNGLVTISFDFPENMVSIGVAFMGIKTNSGNDYWEYPPVNISTPLTRVISMEGNINFKNLQNPGLTIAYQGDTAVISGYLTTNGGSGIVSQKVVQIYRNNTLIGSNTTTGDGFFYYSFSTLPIPINTTAGITVILQSYDTTLPSGNSTFLLEIEFYVTNKINTPLEVSNWTRIILPIVLVAAVIVGVVIFQRKRMDLARKRQLDVKSITKNTKLLIVSSLYESGKGREAIAYTFSIYTDLINQKYHLEKTAGNTIREFAILMVTKYGQDPLRVYPYIQMVESVTYGATRIKPETFARAMALFARVYMELTGVQLQYNMPGGLGSIQDIQIDVKTVNLTPGGASSNPPKK